MSTPDPALTTQRVTRDHARAEFNRRLAAAKLDLAPAVLKQRAVDEAQRAALSVAHQAADIANDSRGIVVATAAALVLWLSRKPITAGIRKLVLRFRTRKSMPRLIGDRFKLLIDDYWEKLKEYADE